MSRLFFLAILLLSTADVNAQQDLDDPRYIYSLDDEDRYGHAVARSLATNPGEAVLYNGQLYKDVNYTKFYYDSSLINYDMKTCLRRQEIKKYTKEPGIKILHVVGKYDPNRKEYIAYYRKYIKK